ncbi:hypothetical protein HS088_TW21G00406 [Tripterygium wilfordii]|uniref:Transmembrane protein n=1 Tax=Tripterygium wilfordii TaxID=458696 RepID=A0A7J7C2D7_TRIWF|nr:hypothetical protein HS088_TW21G00406 [Tripterygium wilfordii]
MLLLQCNHHHIISSKILFPVSHHHHLHRSPSISLISFHKPTKFFSVSASIPPRSDTWLAELQDSTNTTGAPEEEGPIELPLSSPNLFAITDDPSPLQVATSVLLTGAITVLLFRSVRRRAKRARELKFRSSGAKKSLKEEALESLKVMGSSSVDIKSPPSPVQTLLGAISAGVIAVILYKFTTTIEAGLNRQTISDNYSFKIRLVFLTLFLCASQVRQITITIRTIINGLCYLATFIFGLNSVGLFLYSGQLVINSIMGDLSSEEETESKAEEQSGSLNSTAENRTDDAEVSSSSSQADQSSDNTQS